MVLGFSAASNNTSILYIFPTDDVGATVYFAKIQSCQIAIGGDTKQLSQVLSQGLFNNNQNQFYFTAAPTVGTWVIGDMVWNTAPVAGGTPGWVYTASGWKAMASLAA